MNIRNQHPAHPITMQQIIDAACQENPIVGKEVATILQELFSSALPQRSQIAAGQPAIDQRWLPPAAWRK
jgi:hypothetical protein